MEQRKTVLITGSSRGIGRAAATAFARTRSYNLVLNCRNSAEDLQEFNKSLIRTYGINSIAIPADVSDSEQVRELFRQAENVFGGVDILVNNAGISHIGLLSDLTDEEWHAIIDTNLSSCFYCSRAALPYMVHQKAGTIINVSSVWGSQGASCEVAYSATKGGVNAFTRALAKELAPSGISVNAVAFGCIDTEMNLHLTEEDREALSGEIPVGRFASSEEAGSFLLSIAENNPYLTGQIITFDGGWC